MTTATPSTSRKTSSASEPKPADVFVAFGITGDLAKVMTFRSLYRLEKRGLLDCPILGVAVDDWTLDQLKQRARDSIVGTGEQLDEQVFERLADRLLVRRRRLRRRGHLRSGGRGDRRRRAAGLLPGDPAVPLRDASSRGSPRRA